MTAWMTAPELGRNLVTQLKMQRRKRGLFSFLILSRGPNFSCGPLSLQTSPYTNVNSTLPSVPNYKSSKQQMPKPTLFPTLQQIQSIRLFLPNNSERQCTCTIPNP